MLVSYLSFADSKMVPVFQSNVIKIAAPDVLDTVREEHDTVRFKEFVRNRKAMSNVKALCMPMAVIACFLPSAST